MPNEVLLKSGTQLSFADHATDFGPTAANVIETGTPTDVQLSLAGVADGAARQSAKFSFGSTWAGQHSVKAAIEFVATPTAGEAVYFYMGYSESATAGTGNPGGLSGSDAAYAGYSSNLADSVEHLELIGVMYTTAQATTNVQIAEVGLFTPKAANGMLVVRNESGAAFHSDDVECNVIIKPVIDEIQ